MTERPILVRRAGSSDAWSSPETSAYVDEAHLQTLLVADPSRVPGVMQDAYAVDELPTAAGPIDVCIVDLDGALTVVECKLKANSERRRMVIGQVLDYAAAISMAGLEEFLRTWTRRTGMDLAEALEPEAIGALMENIQTGRISLCLAVDSIDADLRRLVEYLNLITLDAVRVTAVQLAYAKHGDLEILIPSTFGGEIATAKARTTRSSWTRESFLEALQFPADRELANWYLDRTEASEPLEGSTEYFWFGAQPGGGVFLHPYGNRYAPLQLWVNSAGHLVLFGNWRNWVVIANHDGFAGLATMFGQDHKGRSRGVRADQFDREAVWAEMVRCARAIAPSTPGSDDEASDPIPI